MGHAFQAVRAWLSVTWWLISFLHPKFEGFLGSSKSQNQTSALKVALVEWLLRTSPLIRILLLAFATHILYNHGSIGAPSYVKASREFYDYITEKIVHVFFEAGKGFQQFLTLVRVPLLLKSLRHLYVWFNLCMVCTPVWLVSLF